MAGVPNPPDPSAADEDTEISRWGEGAASGKDHVELAGNMIDLEAGAKVAGSRFAYLKGDLVKLELAIIQFMVNKLGGEGFTPTITPVLVRERALYGTGFLPDTEQQIYRLADDDLYLTGTSEVALASLHDGEILEEGDLPLRYAGISPCFRREAGAAGKDTRGMVRVHQFDKVELVKIVPPETSYDEHEKLAREVSDIFEALELPYRVMLLCSGDLSFAAAKCYDFEVWSPGTQAWLECSSCSNFEDFQARRMGMRFRREAGAKVEHPHTLNASGVALPRTYATLLENHQQADGSVVVPKALRPYLGGLEVLKPGA
jgi:seryl-tRNA synthetase